MKNLTKYILTFLFILPVGSTVWAQCFITVTSPSAGATLGCGNNIITWTSQFTSGLVRIEYYCDGSWTTILTGTPDDGSYSWNIPPGTCCETARIRISDIYGSCSDISDEFSIYCACSGCQLNITSPGIGETVGCDHTITWTSQYTSGAVRFTSSVLFQRGRSTSIIGPA